MNGIPQPLTTDAEPTGSVNGAAGGTLISAGLDNGAGGGTARNGILEPGEVSQTRYVCNGVAGTAGTNGASGYNSLVWTAFETVGSIDCRCNQHLQI